MPNGGNYTVDEHYVPQIYLKGFSPDQEHIYRYDLKSDMVTLSPIPIKSVAFQKNLYEIKDENGNFIARNHLEHVLHDFESYFSGKRTELLNKVGILDTSPISNIIDEDTKNFWSVYVVLQMLRSPHVLHSAKTFTHFYLKGQGNRLKEEVLAVSTCLPFFTKLMPEAKSVFISFLELVCRLEVFIIIDAKEHFLTSDNPVVSISDNFQKNGIDLIIFPLTPSCAIVWSKPKAIPEHIADSAVKISSEDVLHVDQNVALFANHSVFSKHPFCDLEKEFIYDVNHSEQRKDFKLLLEQEALVDLCKELQDDK